jgi:hypothetical protein
MSKLMSSFLVFCLILVTASAVVINPGKSEVASATVELPAVEIKGQERVMLTFDSFMKSPNPGGWGYYLRLNLNGKSVAKFQDNSSTRLKNRAEIQLAKFDPPYDKTDYWSKDILTVFTGPGTGGVDARLLNDRDQGYHFELDVTDLCVSGQKNSLILTNMFLADDPTTLPLNVDNITLRATVPVSKPGEFNPGNVVKLGSKKSEAGASIEFKFPALEKKSGYKAVLAFKAYYELPHAGGWNYLVNIKINEKNCGRADEQGKLRLLKRHDMLKTTFPAPDDICAFWSGNNLSVFFGNPVSGVDKRVLSDREEGFNYYLDVNSLINYIEMGPDNRVEHANENVLIFNSLLKSKAGETPLILDDVRIILVPEAEADAADLNKKSVSMLPFPPLEFKKKSLNQIFIPESLATAAI